MDLVEDGLRRESLVAVAAMRALETIPQDPMLTGRDALNENASDVVILERLTVNLAGSQVVSGLDLIIRAGECVGVVGPTGCGKSTLLKAILGLQGRSGGKISIFGTDILDADKSVLADRVCYLPQEPFIVAGTLRENLTLKQGRLGDGVLLAALSKAEAPLESWRDGLDTAVHEAGRNLSGGQRQRLSLARAFLSSAKLYVLDEATSQLDAITEERVIAALRDHCGGGTMIAIAHRLGSLAPANRILVMESGRIVEDGGFDELSEADGLLSRLAHASSVRKVRVEQAPMSLAIP